MEKNEPLPSTISQDSSTSYLSFLKFLVRTGTVSLLPILKLELSKQNEGKMNMDSIHPVFNNPARDLVDYKLIRLIKQDTQIGDV